MIYGWAADLVAVGHLAFVGFVAAGALAVWRWPRLAWLHVPAVAWAIWVELSGATCPLTPLEQWLRHAAGQPGYEGGFVARYVWPVLYPPGLTPAHQRWLGVAAAVGNLGAYAALARGWRAPGASRPPM